MVLKKGNSIFVARSTSIGDNTLISALFGYRPDMEMKRISGEEDRFLWSKNTMLHDVHYDAIDAAISLHRIDDDLEFYTTHQGDIIIYSSINGCGPIPQEILESYHRYLSSSFFIREENNEDNKENNKMTIEVNKYIYIAANTTGSSDDQLISALLGYVPTCTKYETIHGCALLWSRTKFLHERSFDLTDAKRRLRERDEKLDIVRTRYGDTIIYRDVNNEVLRILDAYYEYNGIPMAAGRYPFNDRIDSHTILTMPRNLGRSAAMRATSMLNSLYGLNPTGGLLNWNTWCYEFKLYFGVERATGKQKTVCLWKDGEKTIIRGDKSVLSIPVQYAVAWCYVKRKFKTTSQFKKYVDNHSHRMDGITYFEGDERVKGAQASVNNRTKKYDIYDAAALAIAAKHYGSVKTIMNYCDGWGE